MGFKEKEHGIFHVTCDICGDTAEGHEDQLINAGWTWVESTMGDKFINMAWCEKHEEEGRKKLFDTMHDNDKEIRSRKSAILVATEQEENDEVQ